MSTIILVPLDGSKLAEGVLPHVEDLALRLNAEVLLLQVLDVPLKVVAASEGVSGSVLTATEMQVEQTRKVAEEYLSALAEAWRAKDIRVTWETVEGRASTKIVEFAHARNATMIAMSTHGRSGLGQMVFGSVANQVLREAGIPMLLVRPGSKHVGGA